MFVLDFNGALSLQIKEFIDDPRAAVKPKGHAGLASFKKKLMIDAMLFFKYVPNDDAMHLPFFLYI